MTLDEEMELIGTKVPGFGGVYVDSATAVVMLTQEGMDSAGGDYSRLREALSESPGELGYAGDLTPKAGPIIMSGSPGQRVIPHWPSGS